MIMKMKLYSEVFGFIAARLLEPSCKTHPRRRQLQGSAGLSCKPLETRAVAYESSHPEERPRQLQVEHDTKGRVSQW